MTTSFHGATRNSPEILPTPPYIFFQYMTSMPIVAHIQNQEHPLSRVTLLVEEKTPSKN